MELDAIERGLSSVIGFSASPGGAGNRGVVAAGDVAGDAPCPCPKIVRLTRDVDSHNVVKVGVHPSMRCPFGHGHGHGHGKKPKPIAGEGHPYGRRNGERASNKP